MKNTVEASVISRSQSEVNVDKGKMQLVLGTTTKLDTIFPVLDQICLKTHLPKIFYLLMAIYLYYQVIFSSFYPFNQYWFYVHNSTSISPSNSKIVNILDTMEKIAFFFKIETTNEKTDLFTPIIVLLAFFVFFVIVIIIQIFGTSHYNKLRKLIFYTIRFFLDIISPIMVIPASGIIGISIRNLFLNGSKLNWVYLIGGLLLFAIYVLLCYVSLTLLNQSTCIAITLFSSFNMKLSLFFVSICSIFLIFQCVFSLFNYWAMVIVQLSHLAVSIICFYPMCFLQFHGVYANIFFNGITLSTWINDIFFTILYFISPPTAKSGTASSNGTNFYYYAGFVFPVISLIGSLLTAFFYVKLRIASILKELKKLSDFDEEPANVQSTNADIVESDSMMMLANHKLFKNENLTLMSLHLSFTNCLPLFYNLHVINYAVNKFPTVQVLMVIVQCLSFFPGASRKLNNYLKFISQNRELKYHQRFLLFQIFRIKTMRQSSASPEANRRLSDLKTHSNQIFDDVVSFWDLKEVNIPYLEMISKEVSNIDSKWEEAIRDFPNFQKFSDEYCSFLLECKMNIPKAIIMKHRSSLIEMGRNFTVDFPFICLAKSFPQYLKNGIVDSQGNFRRIERNNTANNSASHTFNTASNSNSSGSKGNSSGNNGSFKLSSESMNSSTFDLDPEFEETLGRQLFKQAALRLELNHSLSHKKSYASKLMLFNTFITLAIGCGLLIGLFLYINGYISNRSFSLVYLNVVSNIRYYIDLSIFGTTLKFGYDTKRFSSIDFFNSLSVKDNEYKSNSRDVFQINDQLSFSMIHLNSMISRDLFSVFVAGLADLSTMGGDVYALVADMMLNIVPFCICYEGVPSRYFNTSLKALQPYLYLRLDQVAARKVENGNWFGSDEICEIIANQQAVETSTMKIFLSLLSYELLLSDKEEGKIDIYSVVFTVIPIICYIVPVLIYLKLFSIDVSKLVKILYSANQQHKEEAKHPIRKDAIYEQNQATSDKNPKGHKWVLPFIIIVIICIVNALLIYFMLSETKELNEYIKRSGRWCLTSAIRLASAIEAMNYMLIAVVLNGSSTLNVSTSPQVLTTRKIMISYCLYSLDLLEASNEDLLQGTEKSPPCKGYDDLIDQINYSPTCDVTNNTGMHDSYRCVSTNQGVSILASLIKSVLDDIETTGGKLDDERIIHSLHLLNHHLLDNLVLGTSRFNDAHLEHCSSLQFQALIILITGLILNIFIFLLLLYIYANSNNIYNVAMMLTQRLPPSIFLTNKKLLNFILNRKETKSESEMSTSQSVIYMSHDAIVCTNGSGVVEIINPAVTNILGYTPDQMLGQNISVIFTEFDNNENAANKNEKNQQIEESTHSGDAGRITTQLELMKNGQSALVFEDHFTCLTDYNKEMPCGVTILGMTSHGQTTDNATGATNLGNVESFVFIIRDETQLMEQQREAEKAKAQSENLLFQILPRDIVARINSGEKDISFAVQSASIIFTDVVRFSEYASNLSPQEIMGSLSTLFAAFDKSAKNYELLTKIKLIGDIYMAATGLFADEKVSPKDHAEQILRFGIDCLTELDEVNIKLNANLQLRVGINSGGPLLAGVLGTDKPVFDIIGDPINVAARLQTTDVPGKIQIPKSTYDLVYDGDFVIEERGEVFLKGKGKTIAYLVSPYTQNPIIPLEAESSTNFV